MIALAVADFPLPRGMVAAGELDVDYVETGGHFVDTTAEALPGQPLLLHNSLFNWSLAHPRALELRDAVEVTLHALRRTGAPWLSAHLGFSAAEVQFDVWMRAKSPPLPREELLANITTNVRGLAAAIPVPLILENLDYCSGGAYEQICEPEFIAEVLEQTGAGLLLDLAHAQVSAARLGQPIADYLARLPLDRVLQIHVSGPRERDGALADEHDTLREADYALLAAVLERARPRAVTLEYRRDAAELKAQLERLRGMLG
jgi:uncharacterized protein (UPF0276 family)